MRASRFDRPGEPCLGPAPYSQLASKKAFLLAHVLEFLPQPGLPHSQFPDEQRLFFLLLGVPVLTLIREQGREAGLMVLGVRERFLQALDLLLHLFALRAGVLVEK